MAADLTGFLLNCFIGGEMCSTQPDGSRVRNRIELSFGGRDITIVQRSEIISASVNEYLGQAIPTTTVVVGNVQAEEREAVLKMLEGLSYLLSFATCSDVALYRWEH